MSHTSLPMFLKVNKWLSNGIESMSFSLTEVLQSDPVKRLLNQPYIIFRTIPTNTQLQSSFTSNTTNTNTINISMNAFENKNNDIGYKDLNKIKQSEAFILSNKLSRKENVEPFTFKN